MEERRTKKIKRYLEDVIDERSDLLESTERLINIASLQVQALSKTNASLSQKEELFKYLTKMIVLFTELNHSVLKFLETENLPTVTGIDRAEESQKQESSPTIQDLSDYFKANLNESISMLDFPTDGPKISNGEVLNDSYIRTPLDNTTLKVICSNIINSNRPVTNSDRTLDESTSTAVPVMNNIRTENMTISNAAGGPIGSSGSTKSLIQEHHDAMAQTTYVSPTFSNINESEVFSTVSSVAYQHPLTKFQPPTEIPKQYDTQHMEQIKENLIYLSKKMGFDSDSRFDEAKNHFDKKLPSLNFEYEEPVKEIQVEREEERPVVKEEIHEEETAIKEENNTDPSSTVNSGTNEVTTLDCTVTNQCEDNWRGKVNDTDIRLDGAIGLNNQSVGDGPLESTGAIRKQKLTTEALIECNPSALDTESCEKVSTWLNNNTILENKFLHSNTIAEEVKTELSTAVEKLHNVKRHDRNEEAREQARNGMPDLKFVPVEVPKVIKNDLNADNSSTERKNNGKKKKLKDLNSENGVYEIKKMEPPEVGAVCILSHIVSPSEFYLQIVNDVAGAYLDEVSEKLEEKLKKTDTVFRTKHEAFAKLGKFCFGYIWGERKTWYRLQVLDWELGCPSPDVEVQSVDYGFKCRTAFKYLREMSKDLAHVPMLAIQCHFPLLYPPGSTYSNRLTEWPSVTIESLYNVVGINSDNDRSDFKMFQIIFALLDGTSLGVDLVEYGEPNADSLGKTLVDFGLATEINNEYGEHFDLGEFLEDVDELERAENLNELVLGYDAKDEMRICKFTRKDGTCYKGKNCKLEHIILKDGYTTDKTTAFHTATDDLQLPEKGETMQVLPTAYIDSCTYLVQLVRSPVTKENTNIIMDKNVSDLIDAMNHPKITSKYEHFKIFPTEGEVILAYHSLSKVWMRVAVRDLHFDKDGYLMSMDVYAVDFGDQFIVKLKDTRVMNEDFMHVPFQVILIYLDKYQHRTDCDPKKARRFFEKHMFYKNFLVHIKSNNAPFRVSLTTLKGGEIGPTLMRAGFAEERTMDIYMADSQNGQSKLDTE